MTWPRKHRRKYDYFELTDDAFELRNRGNRGSGWGVREGSKIKRFLDDVEAATRAGVRIHNRKDYPTLTDRYASWLNTVGYLRPAQ